MFDLSYEDFTPAEYDFFQPVEILYGKSHSNLLTTRPDDFTSFLEKNDETLMKTKTFLQKF